jgi:septum formation protein
MLIQYLNKLAHKKIILASASPRRQELLKNIGLKFEVEVSTFDEKLPHSQFKSGAEYAMETARHKALEVSERVPCADLVIGADTVVEHAGRILEKPNDACEAAQVLKSLSGDMHEVHTGVVLVLPRRLAVVTTESLSEGEGPGASATSIQLPKPLVVSFVTTTCVTFDLLDDATVAAYVASGEPFGKAGSYGIQGAAGSFVKSINGCSFNVMGFPIHDFTVEVVKLVNSGILALE